MLASNGLTQGATACYSDKFRVFDGQVHIIFVSNKAKSVRNIEKNPKVCFGINVEWRQGEIRCVLIRGRAELINDVDVLRQAHLKILPKYLSSIKEAENFLQKLVASGEIGKRTLVIIRPEITSSWKI